MFIITMGVLASRERRESKGRSTGKPGLTPGGRTPSGGGGATRDGGTTSSKPATPVYAPYDPSEQDAEQVDQVDDEDVEIVDEDEDFIDGEVDGPLEIEGGGQE